MGLELTETPVKTGKTPTSEINMDSDKSVEEQFNKQKSKLTSLVSDVFADAPFNVPPDSRFVDDEFIPAPELETIGKILIDKYESDFRHIYGANIIYLWKQKGGSSGGANTLGKCIRPTGLVKHFGKLDNDGFSEKVDFIIWAAADHARTHQLTVKQINALIFHELMHTDWEDGKLVVKTHDFEGFAREIEEFGMWKGSIERIAQAVKNNQQIQERLF